MTMPDQTIKLDQDGKVMIGEPMTLLDFKRFLRLVDRPGNCPPYATPNGENSAVASVDQMLVELDIVDRIYTPKPHALLMALNLFDRVPAKERDATVQVVLGMVCTLPDILLAHTMFSVKGAWVQWAGPPREDLDDGHTKLALPMSHEFDDKGMWKLPW